MDATMVNGSGNGTPTAAPPAHETPSNHASEASASNGTRSNGEDCLANMNQSFAKCLSLVCPPIQYPPHCRFNPVQQDAADTMEIEARLEEFFVHAKQLELLFLNDTINEPNEEQRNGSKSDLETEILHLEVELNEKNDLIEKYSDVIRGWEGKFKRLEARMNLERD